MADTKFDVKSKITPKEAPVSQEEKNVLQSARNSGDKLALLDNLIVEGKFSDQPFASAQAISSEIDLTPNELVVAALSNTNSPEIQISKNLSPEKRVELIDRTIQARPDLTVKEVRAACRLLQIAPEPFVEKHTAQQTQQLKESLDNGLRTRNLQRIVQTFRYFPEEDISLVRQRYQDQHGSTIENDAYRVFRRPGDRLAIAMALLGKPQTRSEEFERLRAEVEYEEQIRQKYRLLAPRPMTDSLKKARKGLEEIKLIIERGLELSDSDDNEEIMLLFKSIADSLNKHREDVSFFNYWPEIWIGFLAILIFELLLFLLGGKELAIATPFIIGVWIVSSAILWHYRSIKIQNSIQSRFGKLNLPPNYTRIRAKAEGIKRA